MKRALLCLALIPFASVCSAQERFQCPATIDVSLTVAVPGNGWSVPDRVAATHRLRSATFTDGHPSGLAYLRAFETKTSQGANARTDVYRFPAKYPDGIWLVCSYQDTDAIVFRKLMKSPQTCEVPLRTSARGTEIDAIVCK